MIICIPTLSTDCKTAKISNHFGSAPYYVIYDFAKGMCLQLQNPGSDQEHSICRPAEMLSEYCIDGVLCREIGARAFQELRSAGIHIYRTDAETVEEALEAAVCGKLQEMDLNDCCIEQNARYK